MRQHVKWKKELKISHRLHQIWDMTIIIILQKCLQKNMDAHQQNMQTGLKNVRFDSDIFKFKKKTVKSETISSSEKYDYRINCL